MKYVMFSVVFFRLVGCSPKFKAGDCTQGTSHQEKWQKKAPDIEKVLQVGEENYLYEFPSSYGGELIETNFPIGLYDRIKTKVPCPKELQ
jgi:hypothetical protein